MIPKAVGYIHTSLEKQHPIVNCSFICTKHANRTPRQGKLSYDGGLTQPIFRAVFNVNKHAIYGSTFQTPAI